MAGKAKAALRCFGNPMIDMFLTLPLSAYNQVHAVSQGKNHLEPFLFEQLLDVLHDSYPDALKHLRTAAGGGAVNMGKMLARQQRDVEISLSGAVGRDESGRQIAEELHLYGMQTDFQEVPEHTGRILYIAYMSDGSHAGCEAIASPAAALAYSVPANLDISGSDVFVEGFISGESGLWEQLGEAVEPGHTIILDLGFPGAAEKTASLIAAACSRKLRLMIFGTEDEMNSLYRIMSEQELLKAQAVLVMKQGKYGAGVMSRTFSYHHPAVMSQEPESEILTVGAGDALCAGFLAVFYQEPMERRFHADCMRDALVSGSEFAARMIGDRRKLLRPSSL